MFTSKKAQYLNKDFDRISPITNIESLYYEQAEISNNTDSSYIIRRKSVAKHMPIRVDVNNSSISVKQTQPQEPGEYLDACVNLNINKTYILNPPNPLDNNRPIYDYQQFKINTNQYINIQDLLKYYVSNQYMSSSIGEVYINIDNINSSITNVSNHVDNTSLAMDALSNAISSHTEYYTWNELNTSTLENNGIYNLIYYPYEGHTSYIENSSFIIKVQCVYINNIKHIISLDTACKFSNPDEPIEPTINWEVDQWKLHYNFNSSIITYLKDEYGNEANFDFRNRYLANGKLILQTVNLETIQNNYIFINPDNSSIQIQENEDGNTNTVNNTIINSTNILLNSAVQNTYINNSSFNSCYISLSKNNQCTNINNSSLNIMNGNNNILINCENCSIKIGGNNNTLINVKNLNVSLGNNNIIIGDEIGCLPNTSTLENMKLFFNYSTSTALATDHISSCTFYGGIGNDVSVYVSSLRTTNKY